jgi:hypothetical protein
MEPGVEYGMQMDTSGIQGIVYTYLLVVVCY